MGALLFGPARTFDEVMRTQLDLLDESMLELRLLQMQSAASAEQQRTSARNSVRRGFPHLARAELEGSVRAQRQVVHYVKWQTSLAKMRDMLVDVKLKGEQERVLQRAGRMLGVLNRATSPAALKRVSLAFSANLEALNMKHELVTDAVDDATDADITEDADGTEIDEEVETALESLLVERDMALMNGGGGGTAGPDSPRPRRRGHPLAMLAVPGESGPGDTLLPPPPDL